MYKLPIISRLNRTLTTSKILIKNKKLPICVNCLHFIEHTNNYPCNEQYGGCKKFGEVNLVTGVIEYVLARNYRVNDNKCGNLGLEYYKK